MTNRAFLLANVLVKFFDLTSLTPVELTNASGKRSVSIINVEDKSNLSTKESLQ